MSLQAPTGFARLDAHFERVAAANVAVEGWRRAVLELLYFSAKEARACLFAALFFGALAVTPRGGVLGLPRYDFLLVVAIAIQAGMLRAGLETLDELKAVMLFHVIGFALEVFKTSASVQSWAYPDPAWSKLFGVPLFSGFMYAAVGSYIIQAWRLFELRIVHHPRYWLAGVLAAAIYANFFTHHYVTDVRWYLAAFALGLYARAEVVFRPMDRWRTMPLWLAFVLIGFFIWLAENFGTFMGAWRYPNQLGAWSAVHVGKWSSWSLLVIMTFTIVANLKHVKERIHVPD
jgi:uncharacterized membrane protein YoaT (DUF817 family)